MKKKRGRPKKTVKKEIKPSNKGYIRMLKTRECFMVIGSAFVGAGIDHLIMTDNFAVSAIMFGLGWVLIVLWA